MTTKHITLKSYAVLFPNDTELKVQISCESFICVIHEEFTYQLIKGLKIEHNV